MPARAERRALDSQDPEELFGKNPTEPLVVIRDPELRRLTREIAPSRTREVQLTPAEREAYSRRARVEELDDALGGRIPLRPNVAKKQPPNELDSSIDVVVPPKPTRSQLDKSIAQQKVREEKKVKVKKQEEPIIESVDAAGKTREERALSQQKTPSTEELETDFFVRGEKESFENKARHRKILTEGKSASQLKAETDHIAVEALRKQITELVDVKPTKRWPDEEVLPQKNPIKDEVIRRGYGGNDISIEKRGSGMGLDASEWFAQGDEMHIGKKSVSRRGGAEKKGSRALDSRLPAKKEDEKRSEKEQEVPGFWARTGSFFKKLFGGKEEKETLTQMSARIFRGPQRPFIAEVKPSSVSEKSKELAPVNMRDVIDAWNTGREYARAGVDWKLDTTGVDAKDWVGASVQEIVNRLGQRVKAQLDQKGVSDLEYARNVKPRVMALAAALVGKAERALQYQSGVAPKSRKKAL